MLRIQPLIIVFLLLWITDASAQQPGRHPTASPGHLRAAVVKIDITPDSPKILLGYSPRLSTGIHDRLYHRIVVLDDGVTQFFLVASDICLVAPSLYDQVAARAKKELGIDPVNFWWSATHTHSAPEVGGPGLAIVMAPSIKGRYNHPVDTAYASFVEQKLIEGMAAARKKLVPARLGMGWGYAEANINRRAWDTDGIARGGMNPDGTVDRKIGLIRLDKMDGSPLALLANYSMHGTVMGPGSTVISADAPGIVSEYVEEKTGAPMLYLNGAAGNMASIYCVYPSPEAGHLDQFKVLLGDKILEANRGIAATIDSVQLQAGALTIETPRKEKLDWPADLASYTRPIDTAKNMVLLPVRFLQFNKELALWSAPLELFCEISGAIRERSPFKYTFYYGYTNGWLGYMFTEEEFKHKGYEVENVSPYTVSVERDFTEPIVQYLNGRSISPVAATQKVHPKKTKRP